MYIAAFGFSCWCFLVISLWKIIQDFTECCISYFSIVVIKILWSDNLEKKDFIWAYVARGLGSPNDTDSITTDGRYSGWNWKLRDGSSHLSHKQESRKLNWEWFWLLKQKRPCRDTLLPAGLDVNVLKQPHQIRWYSNAWDYVGHLIWTTTDKSKQKQTNKKQERLNFFLKWKLGSPSSRWQFCVYLLPSLLWWVSLCLVIFWWTKIARDI